MRTDELIDEATSLPLEERAKVVDSLLKTLNPQDDAQAAAWLAVAQQRAAELRSGKIKGIPGEEVFARVRQR